MNHFFVYKGTGRQDAPTATLLVKFWRIKIEFSDRASDEEFLLLFKVTNDKFWETIKWLLLLNASRSESFY